MRQVGQLRRGFTLIELLIVILVIMVLSGILFKISTLVSHKSMVAKATAEMEGIRNALTAYYSEYGIYPPTTKNTYVYECVNWQTKFLQRYLAQHPETGDSAETGFEDGEHIGYEYGLVSHLYVRDRGYQRGPDSYSSDTSRDLAAKRRWASHLKGVNLKESDNRNEELQKGSSANEAPSGYCKRGPDLKGAGKQRYYNAMATMVDPWEQAYNYECRPPYQSYELWSNTLGKQ
jgi:prepilin-type N-terminal cleavage/methylation domain-containing protein